jgi:hypothetical protein
MTSQSHQRMSNASLDGLHVRHMINHIKEFGVTLVVKKHWDWKTELNLKYTPEQEDRSFISRPSLILGMKDDYDQLGKHDIGSLTSNINAGNVIHDLQDFKNTYRFALFKIKTNHSGRRELRTWISANIGSS